ncbi:hypothetical protein [Polaribacter sp.]|uniref:hypothetical protein n=1 Tax=Polaribacter sp. TaxID=1920175 RepID=UPI003F69A519
MMKSLYKIIVILFLVPVIANANDLKKRHEKSRTVNKGFTITKNGKVNINNKYGDVKITTWNSNKVEIEVTITVKGDDLDNVEERFENIDILFESNANSVSARTTFEKEKKGWSFWKRNSRVSYKINYEIKMPDTNSLDVDNDYGSILLDDLSGVANINCDYGKISIGELSADDNSINLDYCSTSTIGFMKSGNVNIDYSKITIEESNNLKVNADYSTVKLDKTTSVNFNTDYGGITVGDAVNVSVNSDYTGMRFGTVRKILEIDTDYGAVSVKRLAKGFEMVDISGQYAGIRIDVDSDAVFEFELDLQYASFKADEDKMEFYKKISKSTKRYYEGKFGRGNTNSKIKIRSQYGGVSIREIN